MLTKRGYIKGLLISLCIIYISCNDSLTIQDSLAFCQSLDQAVPPLTSVQYLDSLALISEELKANKSIDKKVTDELDLSYILYASKSHNTQDHVMSRVDSLIESYKVSTDSVLYYRSVIRTPAILIDPDGCIHLDVLLDAEYYMYKYASRFEAAEFNFLLLKLSSNYANKRELEISDSILRHMLHYSQINNDISSSFKAYVNLGRNKLLENDITTALNYFEQAYGINILDGLPVDPTTLKVLTFNLINCHLAIGDLTDASKLIEINKKRNQVHNEKDVYRELFKYLEGWIFYKTQSYTQLDSLLPSIQEASHENKLLASLDYSLLNASHAYSKKQYSEAIKILDSGNGHNIMNPISEFEATLLRMQIDKATKSYINKDKYVVWIKNSIKSNNYWTSNNMYNLAQEYLTAQEQEQIEYMLNNIKLEHQPSPILDQAYKVALQEKNAENQKYLDFATKLNSKTNSLHLKFYWFIFLAFILITIALIGVYYWRTKANTLKSDQLLLIQKMDQTITLFKITNHDFLNYIEQIKLFLKKGNKLDNTTLEEIKYKLNNIAFVNEIERMQKSKSTFNLYPKVKETYDLYNKLYSPAGSKLSMSKSIILNQNKIIVNKLFESFISNSFKHLKNGETLEIEITQLEENKLEYKQLNLISKSNMIKLQSGLNQNNELISGLAITRKLASSENILIHPKRADGYLSIDIEFELAHN